MNSPPINFTDYQARHKPAAEIEAAAARLRNTAYMAGYRAGLAVGRKDMADESLVRLERSIFCALTFGILVGAIFAVVAGPAVAGWFQ